jgi:hypothetical protein
MAHFAKKLAECNASYGHVVEVLQVGIAPVYLSACLHDRHASRPRTCLLVCIPACLPACPPACLAGRASRSPQVLRRYVWLDVLHVAKACGLAALLATSPVSQWQTNRCAPAAVYSASYALPRSQRVLHLFPRLF